MSLSAREQMICLIAGSPLLPAEAIVVLEGDGLVRVDHAAELFRQGWAPLIVVSGGVDNPSAGAIRGQVCLSRLQQSGVPLEAILLEEGSQHTRDQAVAMVEMARDKGWHRILLVATSYHQYRAYLTFLYEVNARGTALQIVNAPARADWFAQEEWGMRWELLADEFRKIEWYRQEFGHLASYEEAVASLGARS